VPWPTVRDDDETLTQQAASEADETSRFGASFRAWRLASRAAGASEAERGASVDEALDAFEAIARTPVDPGNDNGPMADIAPLLTEPQLRRALAIVAAMDAPKWALGLTGTRSALAAQLARLGHVGEAIAYLAAIDDVPLATPSRGAAWGVVLASLRAADPTKSVASLLEVTAIDPRHADDALVVPMLAAFIDESRDAPSVEDVRAWRAFVRQWNDPRDRDDTLALMASRWPAVS
jgi:hypothetical protein